VGWLLIGAGALCAAERGESLFRFHCAPCHGPDGAGIPIRACFPAGGLLFSGTNEGNLLALDAASGKALWDSRLARPFRAARSLTSSRTGNTLRLRSRGA
jgi:outer membrane protein assembly factor BamB